MTGPAPAAGPLEEAGAAPGAAAESQAAGVEDEPDMAQERPRSSKSEPRETHKPHGGESTRTRMEKWPRINTHSAGQAPKTLTYTLNRHSTGDAGHVNHET